MQEWLEVENPIFDAFEQTLFDRIYLKGLIGQAKNEKPIPMYGVEIVGETWRFMIMEGKEYCISKSFSATEKADLLKIIAILRKFRHILFTRLHNVGSGA